MLRQILLVGLGSALGGMSRFLLGRLAHAYVPMQFPLPTLVINILGCFLIGLFFGHAAKHATLSQDMLILLTVGLCGGFTTFSAFAYENIALMRTGAYTMVLVYITASVSLGILATWLGIELFR